MKRILSLLITLACVAGFIYGCAAVSSSASPEQSVPDEASLPEEKAPTLLLCLPRDGEDHALLRNAFTAKAQALGYEAFISEPAADSVLSDEQVWDVDQLQHQANAVIIYNCDGVEEGLVKKWSDAGIPVVAAGKRLDGQMPVENTMLSRLVKANVAYADGALSKAISSHVIDTLTAQKTSAGFIALFGNTDAQLEFLSFVKADMVLSESKYTPNAPIPVTDAATDLTNVKAAKAILFAGTDTAAWTAAIPSVKTSALMGLCAATPDAFAALQAQTVDFIAFNDPIDLMYKAVDAAHTLLSTGQALAEWSPTAATLVLTPDDPRLASYVK
jgi:hypothetical protein